MSLYKLMSLQVKNFRNLEDDVVHFSSSVNCIFGKNGNGKTNLLEAIHVLIQNKSFRKKTRFPQILSVDGENSEILFSSKFEDETGKAVAISGKLGPDQKRWYLNGKAGKRPTLAKATFINPMDSYIFHSDPKFRRGWLDTQLSNYSQSYKAALSRYQLVLKHRNKLLGQPSNQPNIGVLKTLDQQLAKYARELLDQRAETLTQLAPIMGNCYFELFSRKHELTIQQESKWAEFSESQICSFLQKNWAKDRQLGYTSYGIHKDDIRMWFDGFNAYEFCSMGQQKMAYFSLLFAYIELFRYKFNAYPILLIDDVSAELDFDRWGCLIRYLKGRDFQVFLTTANEQFKQVLKDSLEIREVDVVNGNIASQPSTHRPRPQQVDSQIPATT